MSKISNFFLEKYHAFCYTCGLGFCLFLPKKVAKYEWKYKSGWGIDWGYADIILSPEVEKWLKQNIKHGWYCKSGTGPNVRIYFKNAGEALLFKLMWC